jgi:hypothetical protein
MIATSSILRGKIMTTTPLKKTLKKMQMALSRAYAIYMMKDTFDHLPTLKIEGVRRIDWSGCDL